jgi:hypothetical protein
MRVVRFPQPPQQQNKYILTYNKGQEKYNMEILKTVKSWVSALADTLLSVLALMIVTSVIFKGVAIPFLPNVDVIANVTSIVKGLGSEGLVGLIAIWVLYNIWQKK